MRRRGIHNPETPVGPSFIKRFFWWLFWILGKVWKFILFLWYWIQRIFLIFLLVWLTLWLAWWLSQKPSNLRDWLPAESVLPEVSISGNVISIKNIRNHIWKSEKDFTPWYYNTTYNLNDIESVQYLIIPFTDKDGPAHTMLSFSFSWGQHVVISAEVRKEQWESFDALKGIMNQYEMMYVIGSEEDLIKLRTNFRKNEVYMYPIKVDKEKIQWLFRAMVLRADKLSKEPEFYNTLWNNCATSILSHANALRMEKLEGGTYIFLPSHSDTIVYNAWLIDTDLSLNEARSYYRIDKLARDNTVSWETFSQQIRKARK